ncbi:MAG: MFS transporter [Gordonia sp. (in: high G+C Gram-positive bacteria)]|uniref:MFS transporter n=1 Tax=Gordonia sp. (in: high G+C Gram-positive bacteria) TaxID=84139 RepID=UPI0039E54E8C
MEIVRQLARSPGLGRLLAVRLASQMSDGAFQAALAYSILFNPDRHTAPLAVAGGFAVLLLPYSVIGPFAGALLDHWDRRRVLIWANVARAAAILLVALVMRGGLPEWTVLLGALLVTGCSRFVASGLSAGLPHVAPRSLLVEVNAVFTTLGAGFLAVGASISTVLRRLFGADDVGSGSTLLAGAALALIAAAVAAGFVRRQLGPDRPDAMDRSALYAVGHGMGHGLRAVHDTPTVAVVLTGIGVHRFVFGINTLMFLLVVRTHDFRGLLGDNVQALAVIGACVAGGALVAAFTTPVGVHRIGRRGTVVAALVLAAAAEAALIHLSGVTICLAAVALGFAGQTVKLVGDVAMQSDVSDTYRGQVFAVQDALFNTAFVVATVAAALLIPANGVDPGLVVFAVLAYLAGAAVVWRRHPVGRRPSADLTASA